MPKRPTAPTRNPSRGPRAPGHRFDIDPADDAYTLIDAFEGLAASRQTNALIEALSAIAKHRSDGKVDLADFKREAPAVVRDLMLAARLPYLRAVDITAVIRTFKLIDGGLGVDPDAIEVILRERGRVKRP